MRRSGRCWPSTRRLPLAAAVDAHPGADRLAGARRRPLPAALGPAICCRRSTRCARSWSRAAGSPMPPMRSTEEEQQSTESEALPLEPGRRDVVRLMNLHKAKGLEAPVVFLADPLHDYEFPISVRVERKGSVATGHLRLVRKNQNGFGGTTLAQPAGLGRARGRGEEVRGGRTPAAAVCGRHTSEGPADRESVGERGAEQSLARVRGIPGWSAGAQGVAREARDAEARRESVGQGSRCRGGRPCRPARSRAGCARGR